MCYQYRWPDLCEPYSVKLSLIQILIVFQWFINDIIWDYLNGFVGTKYLNVLGFLFYMF